MRQETGGQISMTDVAEQNLRLQVHSPHLQHGPQQREDQHVSQRSQADEQSQSQAQPGAATATTKLNDGDEEEDEHK